MAVNKRETLTNALLVWRVKFKTRRASGWKTRLIFSSSVVMWGFVALFDPGHSQQQAYTGSYPHPRHQGSTRSL
eukprot:1180829-Prorocentrum_minimum.AAC.3